MAPTARAKTAKTAASAAGPGDDPYLGECRHGVDGVAAGAQQRGPDQDRGRRAGQPGGEGDGAEDDGLGGQGPAASRAGGERGADQAAPVLGGHELRADHQHRDQRDEQARE